MVELRVEKLEAVPKKATDNNGINTYKPDPVRGGPQDGRNGEERGEGGGRLE